MGCGQEKTSLVVGRGSPVVDGADAKPEVAAPQSRHPGRGTPVAPSDASPPDESFVEGSDSLEWVAGAALTPGP